MTAALRTAIYDELSAQILRVIAAGVPVTHLDSHQHIHTLPKLFPVLKGLQRRFQIRRIRSTINLLPLGERMAMSRLLKKRLFKFALRHAYRTISPDGLGEFRDFYACLTTNQIPVLSDPGIDGTSRCPQDALQSRNRSVAVGLAKPAAAPYGAWELPFARIICLHTKSSFPPKAICRAQD
jgi:YdjC-like protein